MKNVGTFKHSLTVECLQKMLTKRRSQAFEKLIDVQSVTNFIGESVSTTSMWNSTNQLDKYYFFL